MKIDQSDFDNASFAATPVRASLPEVLSPIMMPLTQGRVVFVTGAGTSIPKPTGLPSGVELASALVAWMHENGMDTIVATITDPTDLGEVCEAVVLAGNRHTLVAELSTKYPWRRARFNLCHFSLAYFYAEDGLKQSFTFNWDPQVLQASMAFDAVQLAAPSTSDEVASAISPMFFHLHGSIEHPETLAFSQAEIDEPGSLKWSLPSTAGCDHCE